MLGYIGTPLDETLDPEGFFPTGDGGYLDDAGRLYWQGRLTDIIKTGGANVSPREVDEVAHGTSRRQAWRRPSAFRTRRSGSSLSPASCRTMARSSTPSSFWHSYGNSLASYKVPRRVLFFREDEVAITGNAKIKAGELRELATKRLAGK